jgi:hypothetical protein
VSRVNGPDWHAWCYRSPAYTELARAAQSTSISINEERSAWARIHIGVGVTIHHTGTAQNAARTIEQKLQGLQAFSQRDDSLARGKKKPDRDFAETLLSRSQSLRGNSAIARMHRQPLITQQKKPRSPGVFVGARALRRPRQDFVRVAGAGTAGVVRLPKSTCGAVSLPGAASK